MKDELFTYLSSLPQSSPFHPFLQTQEPSTQKPWPLQLGSGQSAENEIQIHKDFFSSLKTMKTLTSIVQQQEIVVPTSAKNNTKKGIKILRHTRSHSHSLPLSLAKAVIKFTFPLHGKKKSPHVRNIALTHSGCVLTAKTFFLHHLRIYCGSALTFSRLL